MDSILKHYITNEIYDVYMINATLILYEQTLLGSD